MQQHNDEFNCYISRRLTKLRDEKRLTQMQVAIKMGDSKSSVAKREIHGVRCIIALTRHFKALGSNPAEEIQKIIELIENE